MALIWLQKIWGVLRPLWKVLLAALLAGIAGFWLCWHFYVTPMEKALEDAKMEAAWYKSCLSKEQEKAVTVPTEAKTEVSAAYVPKEYVEKEQIAAAAAGDRRIYKELEKTDAELTVQPPTVTMKYNGKEYEMPGITGEKTKFEKGKLKSEVSTKATIDLTAVIEEAAKNKAKEQEKHFSLGIYGTTEGPVLGFGYLNKANGFDALLNPVQPSKFWGLGYRRYF
nr:MAG TPA: hypothetical protein [Caudoviricetes sp.]